MDNKFPKINAFNFNYKTSIEACYSGALRPPTKRSLGIAVRPNPKGVKPVFKTYFQPDLMEAAGFYIGFYLKYSFTELASHIRIDVVNPGEGGVKLLAAANNHHCIDYDKSKDGTQLRARCMQTMSDQFLHAFKFDDKCNVFVEPTYIRKGKYLIAPLDDMPIFPAKPIKLDKL